MSAEQQGPPKRLDYPFTPAGQATYEEAKKAYSHRLFKLGVEAGYILT